MPMATHVILGANNIGGVRGLGAIRASRGCGGAFRSRIDLGIQW
jgi:hypothetical protein